MINVLAMYLAHTHTHVAVGVVHQKREKNQCAVIIQQGVLYEKQPPHHNRSCLPLPTASPSSASRKRKRFLQASSPSREAAIHSPPPAGAKLTTVLRRQSPNENHYARQATKNTTSNARCIRPTARVFSWYDGRRLDRALSLSPILDEALPERNAHLVGALQRRGPRRV